MNALIIDFLTEHGSEDMLEMWQGEYQEKLMKLFPKKAKKATSPKDPNKPKRGKSAYLFFCTDNRAKTKEDLGDDAKATEVTKELGRLWNELKESDKKSDKKKLEKYEKQAAEDKERYETEMVDYEPPSEDELEEMMEKKKKSKKSSGKKDPNKPKRGKSAYLFFCADNRAKTKEDLGDEAKATEVTAELGRLWNELKESDKTSDKKKMEKYEKQAAEDKERYEAEMVDYDPPSEEDESEKKPAKKPSEEAQCEEAS
jgi:structure-specific recognition protein 1